MVQAAGKIEAQVADIGERAARFGRVADRSGGEGDLDHRVAIWTLQLELDHVPAVVRLRHLDGVRDTPLVG